MKSTRKTKAAKLYHGKTEKMKIELEQMKLDYTTGKNDIMKI